MHVFDEGRVHARLRQELGAWHDQGQRTVGKADAIIIINARSLPRRGVDVICIINGACALHARQVTTNVWARKWTPNSP